MIIVDTNLIGYLYLASAWSPKAEQALLQDPHWSAPLLWRSEFRNVLALYIRKKLLTLDEAQQIMGEALRLLRDREFEVVSSQVLSLAARSKCSACDCEFVALAKDLAAPLVSRQTNSRTIPRSGYLTRSICGKFPTEKEAALIKSYAVLYRAQSVHRGDCLGGERLSSRATLVCKFKEVIQMALL